jgi:signal transduction histidine kinase
MEQRELLVVDPHIVFQGYATLTFTLGLLLVSWGPLWLGADMMKVPWLQAAFIRIFGSVVIAAGCCALQFSRVQDQVLCQKGLLWFAAAHAVVMVVLMVQQQAILGNGAVSVALHWLQITVTLLLAFWATASGTNQPAPLMSLFSRRPREATAVLRSRYEQQIREAAAQEERNRLARELHDSIKQQIFVIQTAAATAQARIDSDKSGAREALEQVRGSARAAIAELEAMLSQLRAEPLGNQGLIEAIRKECDALGFRTGAKVDCRVGTVPPNESLAPGAQRAVLRVVQESLANIGRHARASHVTVSIDALSETLELKIEDDGQGFDLATERQGMGLRNMRERAEEFDGTLEVMSRPGNGTTVRLSLPIEVVEKPRVYLRNATSCIRITRGLKFLNSE